jgi:hypothetical protein
LRPAGGELPGDASAGQAGAKQQAKASAESGDQAKQDGVIMVSPPPGGRGSHFPHSQVQGGKKCPEDKPDADP